MTSRVFVPKTSNRHFLVRLQIVVSCFFCVFGCGTENDRSTTPAGKTGKAVVTNTDVVQSIQKRPKPASPTTGFVGSDACVECHAEVSKHYAGHPMGQSLAKTSAAPIEDYTSEATFNAPRAPRSKLTMTYDITRTATEVVHTEILKDAEGNVIYESAEPVHYAVGSGKRGRSYLINRDGLLFMSPVTWYSTTSVWDLSPGYEHNNLHFGRRIVDGCLACHAGRVAHQEKKQNVYEKNPFLEECIGCERCHGPAQDHITFHRLEKTPDGKDPIVNPASLPPRERDHVCFQCHLIGEHRLTRYGRGEFDFRPGDNLSDIWTVFVNDRGKEVETETEAVSQVEQMLSSKCYKLSDGKMGCISCHDPHRTPSPDERIMFYRDRCIACHSEGQPECSKPIEERRARTPDDSCVACHMPGVAANDVPHTSQTDHRILRDINAKAEDAHERRGQLKLFEDPAEYIPDDELGRAQGIFLVKTAEQTGRSVLVVDAIPLLTEWLRTVRSDPDAEVALGNAHFLLGDSREAMKVWTKLLSRHPRHEEALRRLMVLCQETEQLDSGIHYANQLVEINPWDYEYFGRLAHMYGSQKQYAKGIESAEKALELNPTAAGIHSWLSKIYEETGNSEKSKYHQEQAAAKSK